LKAGIALQCTVVRDGKEQEIEARELVPGDILILEEGSTIAADAKVRRSPPFQRGRRSRRQANLQILGDYEDKDGSASRDILEKSSKSKPKKESSSESDATAHEDDGSDEEEDGDQDKGPSLCSVDQSAITGESLAVDKYVGDVAYYTCGVKRGKCYGVVSVPAKESFVGRTASLVSSMLPYMTSCRRF